MNSFGGKSVLYKELENFDPLPTCAFFILKELAPMTVADDDGVD